jgi:hypothetical protein
VWLAPNRSPIISERFRSYWKAKKPIALKERAAKWRNNTELVEEYKKSRKATRRSSRRWREPSPPKRGQAPEKAAEDKLRQIKDAEETITNLNGARSTIDEQRKRPATTSWRSS